MFVNNVVLYATFPYYSHVGGTRTYPGSATPFLYSPCMSDVYHTQIQIIYITIFLLRTCNLYVEWYITHDYTPPGRLGLQVPFLGSPAVRDTKIW